MTDSSSALRGLIERLEAAQEGSRELDAAVSIQVGIAANYQGDGVYMCPRFTTSIDAALTLVPEGWGYSLNLTESGEHPLVKLYRSHPVNETKIAEGQTMPVTICIAALKARAVQ